MKLLIHITILVFLSSPAIAQWQWALSADYNSASTGSGSHVLMHPNGNIVCTGSYSGGLALDNLYFSSINGSQFTAEFTPDGVPVRSFTIKETSAQGGANIFHFTRDSRGNMYYAGDMLGGVYFDTTLVNVGANGYIVSIDTALKFVFSKKVADIVRSIDFDYLGNCYASGDLYSQINSIDTFILHNSAGVLQPKFYIAKLDTALQCNWVKQSYGKLSLIGDMVYTNGHTYICGRADSCLVYDTVGLCPQGTASTSFVLKTDTLGQFKSITRCVSNGSAFYSRLDKDTMGNVYAIGWFSNALYFDDDTLVKKLTHNRNLFLAKYSNSGGISWAKQIAANTDATNLSIHTSANGYTYVAGKFSDSIFIDNYKSGTQSTEDMFITRFSPQGQCLGIVTVPNAQPRSVTQDASGNAIVTGHIGPGNSQFGNITLSSPGAKNFFLAKLNALNGTSSITTIPEDGLLSIYANPNAGMFTVAVPEVLVNTDNIQLLIYGMSGELIKAEVANNVNNLLSVNLGNVKRGIYTVALQSGNKRYTGKVVVE